MKNLVLSLIIGLYLTSCQSDSNLKYQIIIPSNQGANKLPVIFFLHGWGGTYNQFIPLVKSEFDDVVMVFPQAPFLEGKKGNSWSKLSLGRNIYWEDVVQAEYSRKKLNEFIKYIVKNFNVDPTRVFLCGNSQGAMMALRVGLNEPYPAKGIVCINGRLPKNLFHDSLSSAAINRIELYIMNGISDTIIPIEVGRALVLELKRKGLKLESHEAETGHNLEKKLFIEIKSWLKKVH